MWSYFVFYDFDFSYLPSVCGKHAGCILLNFGISAVNFKIAISFLAYNKEIVNDCDDDDNNNEVDVQKAIFHTLALSDSLTR